MMGRDRTEIDASAWADVQQWREKTEAAEFAAFKGAFKTQEARDNATFESMRRIPPQVEVLRLVPATLFEPERWVPYKSPESNKDWGYDSFRDDPPVRPFTTIAQLRKRAEWRGVTFGAPTTRTPGNEPDFEAVEFATSDSRFRGHIRTVTGDELVEIRRVWAHGQIARERAEREARHAKEQAEREVVEAERKRLEPWTVASISTAHEKQAAKALDAELQNLVAQKVRLESRLQAAKERVTLALEKQRSVAAELGIDPETGKAVAVRSDDS